MLILAILSFGAIRPALASASTKYENDDTFQFPRNYRPTPGITEDWFKYQGRSKDDYDKTLAGIRMYKLERLNDDKEHRTVNLTLYLGSEAVGVMDDVMETPQRLAIKLHTLRKHQKHRQKRKILPFDTRTTSKWPTTIQYKIDPNVYTTKEEETIKAALKFWSDNTCISFSEQSPTAVITDHHLYFTKGIDGGSYLNSQCLSYVGKEESVAPEQPLYLGSNCLDTVYGIAVHEIGHALGLHHEHQRRDRSSYVQIFPENIESSAEPNFDMSDENDIDSLGLPYDYASIMHYGSKDFSTDENKFSILPKDSSLKSLMGQRSELSFLDSKIINSAYCTDTCSDASLECTNNGYPDPHDCSKCKCPDPYNGDVCNDIKRGSSGCNPQSGTFALTSSTTCLQSPNYSPGDESNYESGDTCSWMIQVPQSCSLNVWFTESSQWPRVLSLSGDVCGDWVDVYKDGPMSWPERLCGSSGIADFKYPADTPLTVNEREFVVTFRSFEHVKTFDWYVKLGFEMCYEAVDASCLEVGPPSPTPSPAPSPTSSPAPTSASTPASTTRTSVTRPSTTKPDLSDCNHNIYPTFKQRVQYFTVVVEITDEIFQQGLLNTYTDIYKNLEDDVRIQLEAALCTEFGKQFNDLEIIRFLEKDGVVFATFFVEFLHDENDVDLTVPEVYMSIESSEQYGSIVFGEIDMLPGKGDPNAPPLQVLPTGAIIGIALSSVVVLVILVGLLVYWACFRVRRDDLSQSSKISTESYGYETGRKPRFNRDPISTVGRPASYGHWGNSDERVSDRPYSKRYGDRQERSHSRDGTGYYH